jgi:hypothetical protein
MILDELFHLCDNHVSSVFQSETAAHDDSISTGEAFGIGVAAAATTGIGVFATWREVSKWRLRDSSTQIPDYDHGNTPTGSQRGGSVTPVRAGMHGETADPSEFLSPTPTGRVKKNTRSRFF